MSETDSLKDEVGTFRFSKKQLPFNRIIPPDLKLTYSDNMVVKNQDGMFVLYFFQNRQPLTFTEEEARAVEKVDSICVAQIVLTPFQMEKLVNAMNVNFQQFLAKFAEVNSGSEESEEETIGE